MVPVRRLPWLPVLVLALPATVSACSSTESAARLCTTSQLVITVVPGGAAGGHYGLLARFRNKGHAECSLVGYPVVADVNASGGHLLAATLTPQGYIGGLRNANTLPAATLAPGQTATAVIEALNTTSSPPCPTVTGETGLFVAPPGQTEGTTFPLVIGNSICSQLEVHPVVAGMTGRE